jgi:hypothetical protein
LNKTTKEDYAVRLDLYEKLVATNPNVTRKGNTMPYTSMNGHMFSFLAKDGKMALRLPTKERELFMERYETDLCVQHGAVMKEYVVVPDGLLERTEELQSYFEVSYEYVSSLEPKPTKKKSE